MKSIRKTVYLKKFKLQYLSLNFNTFLFVFMTISMILSFPYMGLMCFALICLISD